MKLEPCLNQIQRLCEAFDQIAEPSKTITDQTLLVVPSPDLSLADRLQSMQLAVLNNLAQTVANSQGQIALALEFARHVTFYGLSVCPNAELWTTEINDDVELNRFQIERTEIALNALTTQHANDPEVLALDQRQKSLLTIFNRREQRRIDGKPLYEQSEKPADYDAAEAKTKLSDLRSHQRDVAIAHLDLLTNRALINLNIAHLVNSEIIPLFKQAEDSQIDNWTETNAATIIAGRMALEDADTLLRYHVVRHSAFPRRLEAA